MGLYNESIECFDQIVKEQPSYLEALFQKVETLIAANRLEESLQGIELYISSLPQGKDSEDGILASFTKGTILKQLGKNSEAMETFHSILQYKHIPPLLHLKVLKESGKRKEANQLLSKLKELFPENEELKHMKIE